MTGEELIAEVMTRLMPATSILKYDAACFHETGVKLAASLLPAAPTDTERDAVLSTVDRYVSCLLSLIEENRGACTKMLTELDGEKGRLTTPPDMAVRKFYDKQVGELRALKLLRMANMLLDYSEETK